MDGIKSESTRIANQAWRKKPRKFAPKSRLGCKTCKIRRVKCDLGEPSCSKCSSTGRKCDGYDGTGVPNFGSKNNSGTPTDQRDTDIDASMPSESQTQAWVLDTNHTQRWPMPTQNTNIRNLRPFMVLPGSNLGAEAMHFFEHVSIRHLNEHHPSGPWRDNLMRFSQMVPSVRHAATALALIHRNYLSQDRHNRMYQPRSLRDRLTEEGPLIHYNLAIQTLLGQQQNNGKETTAITLLVCYLLICFDHLAGNDVQAMTHLRGGVKLSRSMNQRRLHALDCSVDSASAGVEALASHVARQIQRLDMQAVMFLVDWTPVCIQDAYASQSVSVDGSFESLEQAAHHLQTLVARVMTFYWELQASPDAMPPSLLSDKEFVLWQLEDWSTRFESMRLDGIPYDAKVETFMSESVMRLQQKMAWTLLSSLGPGREMDYDAYVSCFQRCVGMAADVLFAHEEFSGPSMPTFTPEIGVVPVLYLIGVKCRDPTVRREAMRLLQRQPIREAVWDSISAARVVHRVIQIEEGGSVHDETTPSMQAIPSWRRVEALSWVHDVEQEGVVKLDITYTLCGQDEMHHESLVF